MLYRDEFAAVLLFLGMNYHRYTGQSSISFLGASRTNGKVYLQSMCDADGGSALVYDLQYKTHSVCHSNKFYSLQNNTVRYA
jgi:hypothetical protein